MLFVEISANKHLPLLSRIFLKGKQQSGFHGISNVLSGTSSLDCNRRKSQLFDQSRRMEKTKEKEDVETASINGVLSIAKKLSVFDYVGLWSVFSCEILGQYRFQTL
jgi:hypothetical protein